MKNVASQTILGLLIILGSPSYAYQQPQPLKNIEIAISVTKVSSKLYEFKYTLSNPPSNNGDIYSFDIFLDQNPQNDLNLSLQGLPQCQRFLQHSSETIFESHAVTATGSKGPNGWSCGYGTLPTFSQTSYGWGASDDPYVLKPGKSLSGFSLISPGLPAIRTTVVQPDVDVANLPHSYDDDPQKTIDLEDSVRWIGKTVGPKAPPRVFVAENFLNYIVSLKDQSIDLGWIKGSDLENKLTRYFADAKKSLTKSDAKSMRENLEKIVSLSEKNPCRRDRRNDKLNHNEDGFTNEAQALLKYNIEYFLNNYKTSKAKCSTKKDHGNDHDHDRGKIGFRKGDSHNHNK